MKQKNSTLIGSSLLGTWSAEIQLEDKEHDHLTAYFLVHFMADPRRGHGCVLESCHEVDNDVCLIETDYEGSIRNKCHSMAEKDVSWSDVNAFFYFGVKVKAESSKPKAQFELSTGEWIGPWNLILAQDTPKNITNNTTNVTMVDRYVARYVQSPSTMPVFLQDRLPFPSTLYNTPGDYKAFLGSSALAFMTQTQTNYTISNDTTTTKDDPYAPYLETCNHGSVQPILPLMELEFFAKHNQTNHTTTSTPNNNHTTTDMDLQMALKVQYKIMAVPTPAEQAYRVLPVLQSKFQGQHGVFNILGGPYCYGKDVKRGRSLDIRLNSRHNGTGVSFVRGCLPDYPCVPPAAMGGLPTIVAGNGSCDAPVVPNKDLGASNVALLFVSYALAVALLISMTIHCHVMGIQRKKDKQQRRQQQQVDGLIPFLGTAELEPSPPFKGLGDNPASNQREDVNPFGDLLDPSEGAETNKEDPLKEPLLASSPPQTPQPEPLADEKREETI